jgi:hypothetical protein
MVRLFYTASWIHTLISCKICIVPPILLRWTAGHPLVTPLYTYHILVLLFLPPLLDDLCPSGLLSLPSLTSTLPSSFRRYLYPLRRRAGHF